MQQPENGVPGRIRTAGVLLRRQTLYPAEVRRHKLIENLSIVYHKKNHPSSIWTWIDGLFETFQGRQVSFLHSPVFFLYLLYHKMTKMSMTFGKIKPNKIFAIWIDTIQLFVI